MNFFELTIQGLIIRFIVMMAVVIISGFAGIWPLALLALPIFLSCMLGATMKTNLVKSSKKPTPVPIQNKIETIPMRTAVSA